MRDNRRERLGPSENQASVDLDLSDLRDGVEWRGEGILIFFLRYDEGSTFERHRGRVPFDIEKHNSMEIVCKHLIE